MVEENIKLAYFVLKKFNLSFDTEALSYALEGLFLASKSYNGSVKFSTYAHVCIYNKICEYLRLRKNDIPVPEVFDEGYCDSNLEITSTIEYVQNRFKGTPRLIIDTWFELGFNQRETAKELTLSVSYINKVILEFRRRLKTELED